MTVKTEANGQAYNYGYNLNNRSLTSIQSNVNGNNLENKFVYTRGYMTEAEHNGFKYNFAYDGLGREAEVSVGGNTLLEMEYTIGPESTRKAVYATDEETVVKTDGRDNPTEKRYNGSIVSEASYDELGNVAELIDKVKDVCYSYSYNTDGNITNIKETKMILVHQKFK